MSWFKDRIEHLDYELIDPLDLINDDTDNPFVVEDIEEFTAVNIPEGLIQTKEESKEE